MQHPGAVGFPTLEAASHAWDRPRAWLQHGASAFDLSPTGRVCGAAEALCGLGERRPGPARHGQRNRRGQAAEDAGGRRLANHGTRGTCECAGPVARACGGSGVLGAPGATRAASDRLRAGARPPAAVPAATGAPARHARRGGGNAPRTPARAQPRRAAVFAALNKSCRTSTLACAVTGHPSRSAVSALASSQARTKPFSAKKSAAQATAVLGADGRREHNSTKSDMMPRGASD